MEVKAFEWENNHLMLLDQRELPEKEVWLELKHYREVAKAIRDMAVRGAPAIGCVAAYGFLLGIRVGEDAELVYQTLQNTRPTAYNLFWALDRMKKAFMKGKDLEEEAKAIEKEDYMANKKMGEIGKELIPKGARILTHCNTGALATAGWGTALGVIRSAHYSGKEIFVWVDETRPYLQGSRLTAWELQREGIPHKIITDSTAGFLMRKGLVDCVIVGADRITRDYFVANKIGTYSLSVLAKAHGIPFYVVAPKSTFDEKAYGEDSIKIEERSQEEIKNIKGISIAPKESPALHYAFDITPPENITAIITEEVIIKP